MAGLIPEPPVPAQAPHPEVVGGAGMPGPQGPSPAPAMAPEAPEGLKIAARAQVSLAMHMMQKALPVFGPSEEGHALIRALGALMGKFGKPKQESVVPAQIAQMLLAARGDAARQAAEHPVPLPSEGTMPPAAA